MLCIFQLKFQKQQPPASRSKTLQTVLSSPKLSLGVNLPGLDSLPHKDISTNLFHSVLWNPSYIQILNLIFESIFLCYLEAWISPNNDFYLWKMLSLLPPSLGAGVRGKATILFSLPAPLVTSSSLAKPTPFAFAMLFLSTQQSSLQASLSHS